MSDPDANYVCTLTEASIKKAEKELHENPNDRLGPVKTLREWALQQSHLKCRTDTEYLLRMMRSAKGSQLKARSLIENTCQLEQDVPLWFKNIDLSCKSIQQFLDTGYIVPLGVNKEGEFVLLERIGAADTKLILSSKENKNSFCKAFSAIMFYLMRNENLQVNGVHFIADGTGMTVQHQMIWSIPDMKVFNRLFRYCTPYRLKSMQVYNTGPIMEAMMTVAKPFMSKKLQDRIYMHGSNLESLYKIVPKELFPEEYLPDDYTGPKNKPIKVLIEEFKQMMTSNDVVEHIKEITSDKYGVDATKKQNLEPEYQASFRKLNVD